MKYPLTFTADGILFLGMSFSGNGDWSNIKLHLLVPTEISKYMGLWYTGLQSIHLAEIVPKFRDICFSKVRMKQILSRYGDLNVT